MAEWNIKTIIDRIRRLDSLTAQLPPQTLVAWAHMVGEELARYKVSPDYPRKMLAALIKAEQQCVADKFRQPSQGTHDQLSPQTHAHEALYLLAPRLTYKVARTHGQEQRGYQMLLNVYTALLEVRSLRDLGVTSYANPSTLFPELRKLREFFQAIISYHAQRREELEETEEVSHGR